MSVRRRIVVAAGVTIASFGIPLATAAAASASTAPVCGVITGPHTFTLCGSQSVVVGEVLQPDTPGYNTDVQVVAVSTSDGVTTVTTDETYLPLYTSNKPVSFTVVSTSTVSPPPPSSPPPGSPPPGFPPPYHHGHL